MGVAMLVLPGPAVLLIPLGLAILATEFPWARKWLSIVRRWLRVAFKKSN
jgi:tellurite resistance protein TerC